MPSVLHTEYAVFDDGSFSPTAQVEPFLRDEALCFVNVPDHVTDVEAHINQALAHYNDYEVSAHDSL